MTEMTLIQQGLELMAFGMGTVIVFLTLLVLVTRAMSALLTLLPEPAASTPTPSPVRQQSGSGAEVDRRTLAVIAAAIHQHRSGSHHND